MPEVIFPGPDGRLEGRYHPQKNKDAPIAIILHPHPLYGGTMNNKVVYNLHYAFHRIGFTCLRFNFRGVGRSRASTTRASASSPTPPPPSTTCSRSTPTPRTAGWRASPSAPGSACSS